MMTLNRRLIWRLYATLCLVALSPGAHAEPPLSPRADHHQHLLSARGALFMNEPNQTVVVPEAVAQLLRAHEAAWNDPARLTALYSEDAATLDPFELSWLRGAEASARFMGKRFAKPYRFTTLAFTGEAARSQLAVYFSRGEGEARTYIGSALLELARDGAGNYRIAVCYPHFPGPPRQDPIDAEKLVRLLDAAGIARAVVLSEGYWFDSPARPSFRSAAAVDAENDWTAEQAARFPDRLVPFCSLNPISDGAEAALAHCVASGRFRGLKLHFDTSRVDLRNPAHVAKVRDVFRAAARARYALIVHTRDDGEYGAEDARVFVDELLPAAPGVVVQIAHLWGGGAFAPDALAVFATAVSAKKPGTQRLYFDVSDAALVAGAPGQPELVASRMRQIGLDHMLYGSDAAFGTHPDPLGSWQAFRKNIPLTEAEFERIARNEAPYLRSPKAANDGAARAPRRRE